MVEAKYEFDAPLYIDFEDVMNGVESEGMDQWFLSERSQEPFRLHSEPCVSHYRSLAFGAGQYYPRGQ